MEKPSCIQELKDLTSKLADRDVSLKESFKQVKTIIDCKKMTATQKIKKIKELCNGK